MYVKVRLFNIHIKINITGKYDIKLSPLLFDFGCNILKV